MIGGIGTHLQCGVPRILDGSARDSVISNGLGKSTLLQARAAALAEPSAVRDLLPVAEGWVRQGSGYGTIEADLLWTPGDASALRHRRSAFTLSGGFTVW
jgi:hypothetical protein